MDGTLTVLDTEGGKQLAEMKVHTKYVVRALWAPSGALIVSVSWDGSVSVTGKKVMRLTSSQYCLQATGLSKDITRIENVPEARGSSVKISSDY